MTEVKIAESCYCEFPLLYISMVLSCGGQEGRAPEIFVFETKANSFIKAAVAFVENVSKNTAVLRASKALHNVRL